MKKLPLQTVLLTPLLTNVLVVPVDITLIQPPKNVLFSLSLLFQIVRPMSSILLFDGNINVLNVLPSSIFKTKKLVRLWLTSTTVIPTTQLQILLNVLLAFLLNYLLTELVPLIEQWSPIVILTTPRWTNVLFAILDTLRIQMRLPVKKLLPIV